MSKRKANLTRQLSPDHYFLRSQQPLASLIFLLPLIVIYEWGAFSFAESITRKQLTARSWLYEFLKAFGAAGDYLPGLAVVAVLLAWHIARRDRWRFQPRLYAAMALESAVLAVPLLMIALLTGPRHAAAFTLASESARLWQAEMIFSIGAGIYEELVFRLALIALLHLALVDLAHIKPRTGALLALLISTVLFAWSHFTAANPFTLPKLAFYIIAGLYFSIIYLVRGFGIVAATHAFYDMLVVAIAHGLWPAEP